MIKYIFQHSHNAWVQVNLTRDAPYTFMMWGNVEVKADHKDVITEIDHELDIHCIR